MKLHSLSYMSCHREAKGALQYLNYYTIGKHSRLQLFNNPYDAMQSVAYPTLFGEYCDYYAWYTHDIV